LGVLGAISGSAASLNVLDLELGTGVATCSLVEETKDRKFSFCSKNNISASKMFYSKVFQN